MSRSRQIPDYSTHQGIAAVEPPRQVEFQIIFLSWHDNVPGRGTPSRQLNWAIEVDIASLILEPGTERRERKFSRQTLEQDNADIQRALRKKSRKVLRQNNHCIQNRGHPSKIIYKCFKNSPGFPARRVGGDHGQGGRADHPGGHPADQGEESQVSSLYWYRVRWTQLSWSGSAPRTSKSWWSSGTRSAGSVIL